MTARVLIISYFFPPDGGPGTQRALKFARHLWRCGWTPTVLTRTAPARRGRWDPEDATLLREIPGHVTVHRVAAPPRAGAWAQSLPVLDGDETHAWAEAAYDEAARIIGDEFIDAVFITMSPFDLAHLGRRLQAQTGVPVVYDLRDPWALDGWRVRRSRSRAALDLDFMRRTLIGADGVIANNHEARSAMLRAFPGLDHEAVTTITNGYDEDDFGTAGAYRRDPNVFRLVHTGSLHAKRALSERGMVGRLRRLRRHSAESIDPSGRTLEHLLRAAKRLEDRAHPLADRLRIVLAGVPDEATARQAARMGMAYRIDWTGYLPHAESVALVQGADALFLPLHDVAAGRASLVLPGKTFEYLASGRPILGCLPDGDARRLVESSPLGLCARACDAADIADRLGRLLDAWAEGRLDRSAPPAWIARYERRQLAAQLAEFLDRIAGADQQAAMRRAA